VVRGEVPVKMPSAFGRVIIFVFVLGCVFLQSYKASGETPYGFSIPCPVWTKGDSWTFLRSKDVQALESLTAKTAWVVEGVEGYWYRVRIDNATVYLTRELAVRSTADSEGRLTHENNPPLQWYEWPLKLGQQWAQRVNWSKPGSSGSIKQSFRTSKALERVMVPAGEFHAIKIMRDAGGSSDEYWYSPEVKNFVKWIKRGQDGTRIMALSEYKLAGQ
jgi:hypothetical protein